MLNNQIRVVNLHSASTTHQYKEISKVYEESDYTKFTTFKTNRKPDHVGRIKCNITKKGWITNPILTTISALDGRLIIVDGNNRFNALKELNLPVPFVILDGANENDMVTLNMVSKNWTKKDFINFYAENGYEEYMKFKQIIDEYPGFSITTLELVLKLSCGQERGKTVSKLERGEFKIKDIDRSREILDFCKDVKEGSGQGEYVYNQHYFVLTVMRLFRNTNFDADTMLHKLNNNCNMLCRCNNCETYRELLEEIYNMNRRGKSAGVKIHLDFVYDVDDDDE